MSREERKEMRARKGRGMLFHHFVWFHTNFLQMLGKENTTSLKNVKEGWKEGMKDNTGRKEGKKENTWRNEIKNTWKKEGRSVRQWVINGVWQRQQLTFILLCEVLTTTAVNPPSPMLNKPSNVNQNNIDRKEQCWWGRKSAIRAACPSATV